jgi:dTDP-4-dehydrorhamnose 3,5-epimerase
MSRFTVTTLPLPGLKLVERQHLRDERGFLSRLFCASELAAAGWHQPISQINHTLTALAGMVRGLHYQKPPHAEMKLVSCIRGEAWDVAVDLRANSPTFLQWHAQHLSSSNGLALLIPEGFAHGFQALTDNVELLYCHSAPFSPHSEAALDAQDERLAITWPLPILNRSHRDQSPEWLAPDFKGIAP